MKRKIFSILLSITMIMAMMPAMVFADEPDGTGVATWQKLQQEIANAESAKVIYLENDVEATTGDQYIYVKEDKTITLNLNGHSLNRKLTSAPDGENGVVILNHGNLTIKDDSRFENGKITGGKNDGMGGAINNYGMLTIESGMISGNTANYGGAICVSDGKVVIKGGDIYNNTAKAGGGIYVCAKGTLEIRSGYITSNTATDGGGGIFARGDVTMLGGTISGNTAKSHAGGVYVYGDNDTKKYGTKTYWFTMTGGKIKNNKSDKSGGGVYVDYYDMGMKMTGGEITGNTAAEDGAGVFVNQEIQLGGTAKIDSNTVDGVANNLYLEREKGLVLGSAPGKEMKVGLSMAYDEGIFTTSSRDDLTNYITPDNANSKLVYNKTTKEWELVAYYEVTFDVQEHGTAPSKEVIEKGSLATAPTAPTDETYDFGGWFKDKACTKAWDFEKDKVNGNTTLYAKWTPSARAMVISDIENKTFTGKEIVPAVVVQFGTETLVAGTDYTLSFENNKKVGTATVIVTGIGKYTGTTSASFDIVPKKASFKSLKAGRKSFVVTVKKQSKKKVNGYQVRYSLKKDFSTEKTLFIGKKYNKTSKTVKKLKANKKYYVQVRCYKKVSDNVYFSKWSKARKVKTH